MLSLPAAEQRSRWFANRVSNTIRSGATKPLIRQSLRLRSSQFCEHDNKQRPDLFMDWLNFPENETCRVYRLKSLSVTAATIEANTIINEWEF